MLLDQVAEPAGPDGRGTPAPRGGLEDRRAYIACSRTAFILPRALPAIRLARAPPSQHILAPQAASHTGAREHGSHYLPLPAPMPHIRRSRINPADLHVGRAI